MKKRIIVLCIGIFIFIGIIGLSYNSNNKTTFTQDGVTYALTLDGTSTTSFPAKGMYRADVACENATGNWLYDEWKLAIEDITSNNITCDIDFTTISQTNLNSYIMNLSGTTQGTGQVVQENGYRYEGKNPNNYIWFNNELWRIIGVFDENSHGVSNQNLVKIIRNDSIGALAWSVYNSNKYPTLMHLLGEKYYNAENGTEGSFCYVHRNISSNCNYTEIGINDIYRPMIENVAWYLGDYQGPIFIEPDVGGLGTAEEFYNAERGGTAYLEEYIGLMYPSDYGYSVLASSCARTTNLDVYSNVNCAGESWLYGKGSEWTITPISSDMYEVFVVDNGGSLSNYYADYGYAARPVLYLDSSVYVIDGTGTQSDPYIIGMG